MPSLNPHELIVVSEGKGRLHVRFAPGVKTKDANRLFAQIRQHAISNLTTELLIDASSIQEN